MFNLQNYIAVDWGSSNLRLWLFQQGEAIWTYHSREGVTHQRPGAFKELWLTILSRCPHLVKRSCGVAVLLVSRLEHVPRVRHATGLRSCPMFRNSTYPPLPDHHLAVMPGDR